MRFMPLVVVLLTGPIAAQQLDGSFTLRASDRDDRVNVNLQYEDGRSNYGRMVDRSAFSNVTRSGDRITFTLRREPGSFSFEGKGSMERASGWYDFSPSQTFRQELERLGFRDIDARDLFVFALDDLSVARVKQLQQLVSNPLDTDELVQMINHGAGFKYVQSMTDAGFKKLTSDDYRRARDHGVSAEFAREMADLGMKLGLDELIRSRDYGVSVEYVRAMRSAGFEVGHEELIRARDHGVSTDFLRRMRGLGYDRLSLDEYVRMRDHGVTPDFVESLRSLGYTSLSANELVRLRDHGVSASYIQRVKDTFKEKPTVEELIRMRSRGRP